MDVLTPFEYAISSASSAGDDSQECTIPVDQEHINGNYSYSWCTIA